MPRPFAALIFCLIGFGSGPALAAPLHVIASFSILADMARVVGGQDVQVEQLVGPDGDAHEYQPTPRDAQKLAKADMILVNGLGLEGWMDRLVQSAGPQASVVVVSNGVKPREMSENGGPVVPDPHAWQDLANGRLYVQTLAAAFSKAAPSQAAAFAARAKAYDQQLVALDARVRAALGAIPREKRKIITSHDAFGYFGAAYGVTFLAPQGLSPESEPTAAAMAALVRQIKQMDAREVFIENMTDPRLVKQIAAMTRAKMGGVLYADALSAPGGPAPTYLAMFESNLKSLLRALQ